MRYLALFLLASGLVFASSWAGAQSAPYRCPNTKTIMADDVRTPQDVRAFVHCAVDFAKANGLAASREAFNQMGQWRSPSIYIFASRYTYDGTQGTMYIYPIDQTKVSRAFGEVPTGYGGEFFDEVYEILRDFTKGFTYYKRQRPGQTEKQLKTSYVVKVDSGQVAGLDQDAVFGAGVYPTGVRGECSDSPAKTLYDNPSPEALKTFVRCAADRYARRSDYRFLRGPEYRWRDIAVYILSTRLRYRWDHLRQRADRSQPIYQSIFDGNSYASSDVRLRPYRW